jgi:cyclopropane-fatty-acyl-phospholipid synthase
MALTSKQDQRVPLVRAREQALRAGKVAPSVAEQLAPLLGAFFPDGPPVRFCFWDGSSGGPQDGPGEVMVRSPRALRRLLWSPNELGLARAVVAGDVELEGDLRRLLRVLRDAAGVSSYGPRSRPKPKALLQGVVAAARTGALGLPPPPPAEEARVGGWRHSKRRDSVAVRHHYEVGNDFYRLVLGPAMTYSCARFEAPGTTLEEAQRLKHDLICRKLGLSERRGLRLLDVGCGWGSLALHAARHYGAQAVGITLSPSQLEWANGRAEQEGLAGKVEFRLQDYRDLTGERFDVISSVGMFEHVGSEHMGLYFGTLFSLLGPGGRLLNHAISKPGSSKMKGARFIARYIFPDGELVDVGDVVKGMERAGFEVRDVESLREHYVDTLRAWVANLEAAWHQAVALVGEARARAWRLYMSASANAFEEHKISVHQVLGVRTSPGGESGMPRTRRKW